MRRNYYMIVIALVVLAGCTVQTSENPTVTIGATFPLSGDVAFLGEGARKAVELAKADMNGSPLQFDVRYQDDQLSPSTGATNARKLVNADHVDVLLSVGSPVGNAVSPIAQSNGVVHLNAGASDAAVANGSYNFIHWTRPDAEARTWVDEAMRRNLSRVAIITKQNEGLIDIKESVETYAEGAGMNIVHSDTFAPGQNQYRTIITKARRSEPDVYLLLSDSPDLEQVYRQMQELGVDKPISGIESFELSSDPALFEGEWYVSAAGATPEFRQRYEAEYGKSPSLVTPNSYDIAKLAMEAYTDFYERHGRLPSQEEVVEYLHEIENYSGVVGTISIDEQGIIKSQPSVKVIRNGTPRRVL